MGGYRARLILALGMVAAVAGLAGPIGPARGLSGSPPPPTPVPPFGSPSPFPTSLTTPVPSTRPPPLGAPSAELADLDTGQVLFAKGARVRRPIASLTKIMTALLALERHDPDQLVVVRADAASQGGAVLGLRAGERITVRDLAYGMLLSSANDAAVALADSVSGSVPDFVRLMNRRARALGLRDTEFSSPTGLDDRGYSTARDLIVLTRAAYADPAFATIVRTKTWDIPSPSGPPRRIQNRNPLLWLYPGALGVKTGTTLQAGHCLVAAASRGGIRAAVVVLGDPVEAFDDVAALLNFGLLEFRPIVAVSAGRSVGTVGVGGARIEGLASADLTVLVRRDRPGIVVRMVRPVPGLRPPLPAGAVIGWLEVTVDGTPRGRVPVVTAVAVPATSGPPVPGPSPSVGAAVLYRLVLALLRALIRAFL